ncbi:MAG TPA: DUF4912 domain-containing protein [Pyrinomonadaceae bacterium]|nr:DUF4912 domain-containing protein [Pyrinomonadaceae bacterium]
MATKTDKERTPVGKRSAKAKSEVDPFESVVEVKAVKKTGLRKVAAEVFGEVAAPKKRVRKTAKTIESDPFATTVATASPVKKRAAKTTARALKAASKAAKVPGKADSRKKNLDITAELAVEEPKVKLSPTFKALADVKLPELQKENRARLQMQTPTRIYFYWSVKENPWAILTNVFGSDLGNYTLVIKLIDQTYGHETINQCEAEGNWWFDVEPDRKYQAEVGFFAPGRPYFRILHSNSIETPRRSPSPRAATDSDWRVSANKFAEVLDVAGFSRDAFDVAMAGDDIALAQDASQQAFTSFIGSGEVQIEGISSDELRYALIALASGMTLEELRGKVSPTLFAILQANAGQINAGRAMSSLTEHFEIEETEFTEEEFGPAVYGASLVNFPKTLKTKTVSNKKPSIELAPRYNPVSSHSLGR